MQRNDTPLLAEARQLIDSVRGKALSMDERKRRAIELAALMLTESQREQTAEEKRHQGQIARMIADPVGKAFTTDMTDECFRSHSSRRIANQLVYTLKQFGVPHYLPLHRRLQLLAFRLFGKPFASVLIPLVRRMIRKETAQVILPGEPEPLAKHMAARRQDGVRINLNRLGEAILGEGEAQHRLRIYLEDLAKPEVEYISIKISTLCSQINLCDFEGTLSLLAERLRLLYRSAMQNQFRRGDGTLVPKFVNLDMEEYRDLH